MGQNGLMRTPIGALALVSVALVIASPAQAQKLTIQTSSLSTIVVPHDIKPKNKLNKGDYIYFKDLLLNRVPQFGKKKGRPVAFDEGLITYTNGKDRKLTCIVTFPGVGTITYGGMMIDRPDGTTVFPIISGTGGFKGVTGTVTLGKGAKTPANIFAITVPGNPINIGGGGVA